MALAFEHESRVRELIQLFSRERDPEKVEGVGRSASAAFEAGRHAAQVWAQVAKDLTLTMHSQSAVVH
jgi:hypothetical protein